MTAIPPYPLAWPEGFPRTPAGKRGKSQFRTTLAGAVKNVRESLMKFGADSRCGLSNVVATTNAAGLDLELGQHEADPGVAVWFEWDGATRCIAVDRYPTPAENLQAIHHILEARRTEICHAGIAIVRATLKGFVALPSPAGSHWSDILGVPKSASPAAIEAAWKAKMIAAHPDRPGGSAEAAARINAARDRALQEQAG